MRHPVAFPALVLGLLAILSIVLLINRKQVERVGAQVEKATSDLGEAIERRAGTFLTVVFWAGLVFLVVAIPAAPHMRSATLSANDHDRLAKLTEAASLAFEGDEIRIDRRRLGNVVVWVERSSFERVPFPDRDHAVEQLAQAWCPAFPTLPFFPSLYVRDIRNGKSLASRLCTEKVIPR